jgi:hypothetical protein
MNLTNNLNPRASNTTTQKGNSPHPDKKRVWRLSYLSKQHRSKTPAYMSYIQRICDLSRRGDMKTVADMIKGYYSDKNENPWHKVNNNVQTFIKKETSKDKLSEILILLRAAVFSSLDILSFGLVDKIGTVDIIKAFTTEETWKLGRRNARNHCLDVVDKLIEKRNTRYLTPSALKRDGFGFLVSRIEEAQWEQFKKAKPKVTKGELDLSKMEKSVIGSKFLRDQMIMETKINAKDPRAEALLEAYDLQIVEIEIDRSSIITSPAPTEQVTLNGQPVVEDDEEKEEKPKRKTTKGDQTPLTDFLSEEKKAVKAPKKKSSRKKRGLKK